MVVLTKSSLIDDALHEFGLSDEYSLMGVDEVGDSIPDDNGLVGVSAIPSVWWCCEFDRWGYHDVGLLGGQHESLIDWWRWLLLSKRNLS